MSIKSNDAWNELKPGDTFIDTSDAVSTKIINLQYKREGLRTLINRIEGNDLFDVKRIDYKVANNTSKPRQLSELKIIIPDELQNIDLLNYVEQEVIKYMYKHCKYNKSKTATQLGVSRGFINTKIKSYGIDI